MIARMLARGIPVKLRVNVQSHFLTDDPEQLQRHRAICRARIRS